MKYSTEIRTERVNIKITKRWLNYIRRKLTVDGPRGHKLRHHMYFLGARKNNKQKMSKKTN